MRGELVAIDLETTGLDPASDAIIEIGAVRMEDGKILEEYSQLINPGIPIPERTTLLTGIAQEDVANAPRLNSVLPDIEMFIGKAPVIGHSVSFDAGFMNRAGAMTGNLLLDTYDLASVLLPRMARYNLHNLTAEFGLVLEDAHRALDDARAAGELYWVLWNKALDLPYATLQEINDAARGHNWHAAPVFAAALKERTEQLKGSPPDKNTPMPFQPLPDTEQPLQPVENPQPINSAMAGFILSDGGPLSLQLTSFEERPQQIAMSTAVAEAFNENEHLIVEAGTGTGKSMAYLIPAVMWAQTNGERVVISTDTISLQDQLVNKDIPTVQGAFDERIKAAIVKGRGNYLCARRLSALRRRRPTNIDELRTLAKVLVWMLESDSGDKEEISLRGPAENGTWRRLSAQDEGCSLSRCEALGKICPFYKARKSAETAHVLVVNHALLISDAKTDNRVLPEYRYLVMDEAHHLEDAVTNSMSFRLDAGTLNRRLGDLGGPKRGLLADMLRSLRDGAPDKTVDRIEQFVNNVHEATSVMGTHVEKLFQELRGYAESTGNVRASDFVSHVRFTPADRVQPRFERVRRTWEVLSEFLDIISYVLEQLEGGLPGLRKYEIEGLDDLTSAIGTASRYFAEVRGQLNDFVQEPDANTVHWFSINQDPRQDTLHTAPLHVGPHVQTHIWTQCNSVVLTSATLQTGGSFDHLKSRVYADRVKTIEVGSPFNYRESTLVYVPTDIPEPNQRDKYQQAVERGIIELATALNGRVLALFTSYSQLRQTAKTVTPRLALGNISVLDQSDGTSREALLDSFKSLDRAVLMGTRSFWEGIDIPGESLSALVIARLPFPVPSDPVFAARSETYNNSFNDYAVPEAILRFRQGFGRLIRSSTDRGVVAVFDSRIIKKSYGQTFLTSLPDCEIVQGKLEDLPNMATDWLK